MLMFFIVIDTPTGDKDVILLMRAQRGDRDSLGALLETHRPALRNWLMYQFHLSIDNAEDIIQHAYLQITERITTMKIDCSFRTYLFAVARHRCLDHRRREERHGEVVLEDNHATPSEESGVLTRMAIKDAVASLSSYERLLLQYTYTDELTCTEIAPLMGKSISQISRDLKKVREKISNLLYA